MAEEAIATRKRDAARTKGIILRSAVAEFAANGPAGTRVDEVAIRAGVNKSLIYQYFGSKQELYAEVLTDVLSRTAERLGALADGNAAASDGSNFQRNVEMFLRGHLTLLDELPEYPRLMAWENLDGGKTLTKPQVRRAFLALLEKLQNMLKSLESHGVDMSVFEPRQVMMSALALGHCFVLYKALSHDVLRTADDDNANRESWIKFCARMYSGMTK